MRTPPRGRSAAQLLADFGHDLPTKPEPERPGKEPYLFHASPRHGQRRPGRGWSPARTPVVQYRMTSDQAAAWWPFIANPPLPPTGAQIGIDELSGGSFYADPLGWVLDDTVPVTNPNVITFGKPGGGKSTNTKNFATLMMDFGYKVFVLGDPKDEYEPLCRAFGVHPFAVGPGLSARINPLDFGPLGDGWDTLDRVEARRRAGIIFRRWLTLISPTWAPSDDRTPRVADGLDRTPTAKHDSNVVASKNAESVGEAAALLSAISDPIRLQLLNQLAARTSCVCDLEVEPEIPGNLLSYHLKVLREAGLIVGARRGRWIDYSLTEGALDRLHAALPSAQKASRHLTVIGWNHPPTDAQRRRPTGKSEPIMNIKILGPGCANCVKLEKIAREAVAELGLDATIEKVVDYADIAAYDIMRTPGLVVDEQVLVSGRVPTKAHVKELLAPLAR